MGSNVFLRGAGVCRRAWVGIGLFALVGCAAAGSASFVLRPPVVQQCQQVPLQGCEELSDGVLLYLNGQKEQGRTKLLQGAAKNAPEQVRQYAVALRALETTVPGVQQYTQPLGEITTILIQASAASQAAPDRASGQVPVGLVPNPYGQAPPAARDNRFLTADTDVTRMRYGTLGSPSEVSPWCSKVFGLAQCVVVQRGTLVLTDLVSVGNQCDGQFLAVMRGGLLQFRFDGPFDLHGARIVIPPTDALILGQLNDVPELTDKEKKPGNRAEPPAAPTPSRTCGFYYSGYMPYEGASEASSLVAKELD